MLSLADVSAVWISAGNAFGDELPLAVTGCLVEPLQLTPGCEISLLCREGGAGQALPAAVFDVLRRVLAQHAESCERARSTPSPMLLKFDQVGSFWLPASFWHTLNWAMLQQLLQAGQSLPERLLSLALERDLGL